MQAITSSVLGIEAAPPEVAARHFREKLALETDPADVNRDMAAGVDDFVVVDVRSSDAYREAHVPGAISLPWREISEGASLPLERDRVAIVYCWGPHCDGATRGAARLAALGYRVKEMIGGIDGWRREGLPVVPAS
ncbi:MAG TPA: rhodanese-like domain-containing protein [Candidatus Angelobacter sp.]|jgi:rhodanese-related sulfurtransferase|nr:rhodanese-like domain-containing protein [Candidatus Angelobacter sp.]